MQKKKILTEYAPGIIRGLSGIIPGGISARDFSAIMANPDDALSEDILDGLASVGIGKKRGQQYFFQSGDRLRAAVELLKAGSAMDLVSEALDWKDFEGLAAEILSCHGFAVMRNLVLTKPRMEIDVVGVRLGVAMLIDCKHWKRYSSAVLATAVRKQIERTRHYVSKTRGAVAVPVIVTLYQDRMSFIDRVPIVPIFQFSSFVDEFYGSLDDLNTIKT